MPKGEAALTALLFILGIGNAAASELSPWFMVTVPLLGFLLGIVARLTWADTHDNRDHRVWMTKMRAERARERFWADLYRVPEHRTEAELEFERVRFEAYAPFVAKLRAEPIWSPEEAATIERQIVQRVTGESDDE